MDNLDRQESDQESTNWPTEDDLNRLAQFFEPPAIAPLSLDNDPLSTPVHLMSRDELLAHHLAARRRWEEEREEMQAEMKEMRRKSSVNVMRQQHVADLRWEMQKSRDSVAVARRAAELAIRSAKESARLSLIETAHHMELVQTLYGRTPEQSTAARRERRKCGWDGIGPHVVIDMPTLFANGLAVKTTAHDIYNRLRVGYGGRNTYGHIQEIWLRPVDRNSVTALVAFSSLKTASRLLRARPLFLHNCMLKFHYVPGTGNNYRWAEELRKRERKLHQEEEEGEVQSESDDASSIADGAAAPSVAVVGKTARAAQRATASSLSVSSKRESAPSKAGSGGKPRGKKTSAQKNAQRARKRKACAIELESRCGQ